MLLGQKCLSLKIVKYKLNYHWDWYNMHLPFMIHAISQRDNTVQRVVKLEILTLDIWK